MPQLIYTAPEACTKTSGTMTVNNNSSGFCTVSLSNGAVCSADSFAMCSVPDLPFGTYTVEVFNDCSPQVTLVNVNGQTNTNNGTSYFNVVLNNSIPNLDITLICINA